MRSEIVPVLPFALTERTGVSSNSGKSTIAKSQNQVFSSRNPQWEFGYRYCWAAMLEHG